MNYFDEFLLIKLLWYFVPQKKLWSFDTIKEWPHRLRDGLNMCLYSRGNPHLTSWFCKDKLDPTLNSKMVSEPLHDLDRLLSGFLLVHTQNAGFVWVKG
jgi:hypothetical protein